MDQVHECKICGARQESLPEILKTCIHGGRIDLEIVFVCRCGRSYLTTFEVNKCECKENKGFRDLCR
jgi:hypothetical protein